MILIDPDLLDNQLQIIAFQLGLLKDILEYLHGGLGDAVHLNDGVAFVLRHGDMVIETIHAAQQVAFQIIVGFFQGLLILRVLHDIPDALALRGVQFLLQIGEDFRRMLRRALGLADVLLLAGKVGVEAFQHD